MTHYQAAFSLSAASYLPLLAIWLPKTVESRIKIRKSQSNWGDLNDSPV
jgi:hypothetical protein